MDIKRTYITTNDHSNEYKAALDWIGSKIGNQDEQIQAAWLKRWKNLEQFENKYGEELYMYASENSVDFTKFNGLVYSLMEDMYIRFYGTQLPEEKFGI